MKIKYDLEFFKPILILAAICIVVSLALGVTNGVTAPIIETNTKKSADATRLELIPQAKTFEQLDITASGAKEAYVAKDGDKVIGYVITATGKGYGGELPVMVAYDTKGVITKTKVLSNAETPGLGKKVEDTTFNEQFIGATGAIQAKQLDAISGATISSKAVLAAINIATETLMLVNGGAK